MLETNFSEPANSELARQIEELAPDARLLAEHGFGPDLAKCLVAAIATGAPDIGELRANGVAAASAVAICQAISDRHARVAAAVSRLNELKAKRAAAPKPVVDNGMSALSALHTVCQEIERGRAGCLTTICAAGWSQSFARELVSMIDASLMQNRGISRE